MEATTFFEDALDIANHAMLQSSSGSDSKVPEWLYWVGSALILAFMIWYCCFRNPHLTPAQRNHVNAAGGNPAATMVAYLTVPDDPAQPPR